MADREPIGKKLRFEVFKRDSFTCQYCGAKAPEAVLHCDHIDPVAEGGKSDILNLITACEGCNLGKGARKLDDRSVVEKQHAQLSELQARREQLEMLLDWRNQLAATTQSEVDVLCSIISQYGWEPNESGRQDLRKWVKKFGLADTMQAIEESFLGNMTYSGDRPLERGWNASFKKIPLYAGFVRAGRENPHRAKCAYIQGIIRNKMDDRTFRCIEQLEEAIMVNGYSVEILEAAAKQSGGWADFCKIAGEMMGRGRSQ